MADSEELEEIRRRKREALERRLRDGEPAGAAAEDDADGGSAGSTPTTPIHVETESHLSTLVADHGVVLVDFYADWCGPCRMLEPTVEALASDSAAAVAKVDIDAHGGLASQYGVRGVPTLLLFADGEPVERVVGVQDRGTLESLVASYAG